MQISADALYSCLLDDLKDQGLDGSQEPPYLGLTTKLAAASNIRRSLLKKLQADNTEVLDSRALLKFLTSNFSCKEWELQDDSDEDQLLYGELKRAIYDFWFPAGQPLIGNDQMIFDHAGVGPGSAVGALGSDFYSKLFASPLSCSSAYVYKLYTDCISTFPDWDSAEQFRSLSHGSANVVAGSRLSFVPKDKTVSRVICVEPNLNMFFQLGIGTILERRIHTYFGKYLKDQPFKNRELARLGSQGFGPVTIDLSSASDSMSLKMLKYMLPRSFYDLLCRFRSKSTDIPGLGYTELDMVSSMGNGFTFPLQTMFFSCIVLAAARVAGIKLRHDSLYGKDAWGVFGDDIICDESIKDNVLRLLHLCGFTVNKDKTFVEGPFRESCGSDFFLGRNIRGVYVKHLDSMQKLYAVINQLNLFSTRTGIVLRKTVGYLLNFVKWNPVPCWENDDAGIRVPFSLVRVTHPRSTILHGSLLYHAYRARGRFMRIGDSAIFVGKHHKPLIYNPEGLFISFLRRAVNSSSISVRLDRTRYERKRCVAPNWDTHPAGHLLDGWFDWQRWETAVALNI
jgi:hypothetical protein